MWWCMSIRPGMARTDGEVTCANNPLPWPLPGRIAPAPATARAFRNFLREATEPKGFPFALRKSADGSKFPEVRFPMLISSHLQKSCVLRRGATSHVYGANVPGAVNFAHPAGPNHAGDFVGTEFGTIGGPP